MSTKKSNPSIQALANNYIKSLSQIGSGRPMTNNRQTAINLTGYKPVDWGSFDEIDQYSEPGFGSRVLDVLARPLYSVANASLAMAQNINAIQGDEGSVARNPFDAAWKGFTGEEKTTFADVIREDLRGAKIAGVPVENIKPFSAIDSSKTFEDIVNGEGSGPSVADVTAGVGGLGLDITLDPVNLVAGGISAAARGASKLARGTKAVEEPARSVTASLPVKEYWKEIVDPAEIAKYTSPRTEVVSTAPIADNIVEEASKPPVVQLVNETRKPAEPSIADANLMGLRLQEITSKESSRLSKIDKMRAKRPTWADEVNSDEYLGSIQVALDSTRISARDLARITGLPYKTAQRHIRLMELDGIVDSAQAAAKSRGLAQNGNLSHYPRHVLTGKLPDELVLNQVPPTVASRAAEMYDGVMPKLREDADFMASKGQAPKISASDGKEYSVSMADALESLPREIVENYNFGALGRKGAANLYPSQWLAGAAESLRMSELGVEASRAIPVIAGAMRNALRGNAARAGTIDSAGSINVVAEAFANNMDALAAKLVETNKKLGTKNLVDGEAIAKTKADDIQNSFENGTLSEAIDSVANVGNDISKMAHQIGATNDAAIAATQQVGPMVAKIAPEADIAAARSAKAAENIRLKEGFTPQADKKIMQRNGRLYMLVERDAEEIAREAGLPVLTLGEKPALVMSSFLERLMYPLRNATQFGYRTGDMAHTWRADVGRADHEASLFRETLSKLAKTHMPDDINSAWTAYRRGVISNSIADPKVFAAYTDLRGVYEHLFGGGLRGRLWRNGASIKAVNSAFDEVGLSYRFKPPIKPEDRALVPDQVNDWDIKDPLSDLEKINKAITLIETRQTVGVSASRLGSAVPKPGYVKLRSGELSKLGEYVDTGLFYPREAGEQIQQLDRLIGSTTSFHGQKGGIAWFANHIIDPIMQIWKPSMTIARPGHFWRNLWSDIIIAAFNGVMSVRPYRIAAKTLKAAGQFTQGQKTSTVMSKLGGLSKLQDEIVSGADTAFLYKGVPISYQRLYKMAHDEGLMISWHSSEDILEKSSKLADRLLATKYMQVAGKANETEGQFARLAHFQHLLEKGVDVAEAGKTVRRYHPDVRGLTPFEQKYLRRIFPFYSWFRQAMPVVLGTIISKPGRVTGLMKTEYNIAEAMGINPDTLSDPFPDDKLYPSFIRDNIVGPIAGDWGVNLGTPQEALLGDTLNGSPARNIAGMLNPVFKVPYEVATRTNIGTGANITDMSDYADSQLPIVNQVATISGHSVTGLGEQQRQVALGEKNEFINSQMVNFLTGLGLMDMGKESYRNIATRERMQ